MTKLSHSVEQNNLVVPKINLKSADDNALFFSKGSIFSKEFLQTLEQIMITPFAAGSECSNSVPSRPMGVGKEVQRTISERKSCSSPNLRSREVLINSDGNNLTQTR